MYGLFPSFKTFSGIIILLFVSVFARASHLIGGEMSYVYLGGNQYKITLIIYQDCIQGDPQAISEDNPAFINVFDGTGAQISPYPYDSVSFSSASSVIIVGDAPCMNTDTILCIQKKVFNKVYNLPPNIHGYNIVHQRCCRDANIVNINTPTELGETIYCTIPPSGIAATNNSPQFNNYPPEVLLINYPLVFDHSATDADGDSLSYHLGAAYIGGTTNDTKPYPVHPPYDNVTYPYPYSAFSPLTASPALQIDPVTGILTGTPTALGRYLITVYCDEWRNGVKLNTLVRDFQFVVTGSNFISYHPYAGNDTTIIAGDSIEFNATGAVQYSWSPATYLSDTAINNPMGHYPIQGTYQYVLTGNDSAGCVGHDTINVNVAGIISLNIPNAFTPDNDGINDRFYPLRDAISTINSFKIFNREGKLLYTGTGHYASWDGTYHGTLQGMGTYLWTLDYVDSKGKHANASGQVTLIR